MKIPVRASEVIALLGGTTAVARLLGISAPSVHEWMYRDKIPADKLMRLSSAIEVATKLKVRRWHLFPTEWPSIWPELIGTKGAPPVAHVIRSAAK